ncbi:MAG TPA: M48 family metallopeptidase [Pseudobdellovibrionaceae bacterium]|nr:M48 family metallopeptidase [Pseudobdellovibrionaceae bacterium]
MNRLNFLAIACAFALLSCQTSPTGRRQLVLVSESQMDSLGDQSFEDLKKKMPIEKDPGVNAYVKCVADAITGVLPEKRKWEVVVFKEDTANAFAVPGGHIGVHTGLLKVAKTPDQLAAVLGHEVAHVLAEHSRARVSEQLLTTGVLAVGGVLAQKEGKDYRLLMAALGLGAQFGITLPNSRAQETEADVMGLDFMAKAGFNPEESVRLWRNMEQASKGAPPEFMSTHPSHGTRIGTLGKNIPKVMPEYRAAKNHPNCEI